MFEIVGPEPTFDLSECRRLADAAEDMLDPLPLAVDIEEGFTSSYAPELRSMVGEDLSWLRVFVDGSVEEPDDVLCGAVFEYLAACDVAAVVV